LNQIQTNSPFILCCTNLPVNETGIVLNYELVPISYRGWSYVDIRNEISLHENSWIDQIQNWHHQLSSHFSKATNYWWLSPGSRLIFWESYHAISFSPLFFFLGSISIFEKEKKNVIILNAPDELKELLKEWKISNNYESGVVPAKNILKNAATSLISCKNYVSNLFNIVTKNIVSKIVSKPRVLTQSDLIIISTAFNINQIEKMGDHYFGRYFDNTSGAYQLDKLWVYSDIGSDRKFPKPIMQLHKENYCFLSSYTSLIGIGASLFKAIYFTLIFILNKNRAPKLNINNIHLNHFTKIFIKKLIIEQSIYDGLINFYKFKKLLECNSKANYIFYPYEEQILERALLLAVNKNSKKIKTYGFSHASVNQGHLYLKRPTPDFYPRPDIILTTSAEMLNYLTKFNIPRETIQSIGSPRYLEPPNTCQQTISVDKETILAIFSFGFEFKIFTQLLIKHQEKLSKYKFKLRGSFHSWRDEQNLCEDLLDKNKIQYTLANGDLVAEILSADIIIFDISTAGLQASLLGKYVIRMALSQSMYTKHLFDLTKQSHIKYHSNLNDLITDIENFLLLDKSSQLKLKILQRKLAMMILSPPTTLPYLN